MRRGQASKEPKATEPQKIRSVVSDPQESSDEKYNQPVASEVQRKANVVSLG